MEKIEKNINNNNNFESKKSSRLRSIVAALALSLFPAESSAQTPQLYEEARQEVNSSQDGQGLFNIGVYINETGAIINIGSINTESESEWHEESEIMPVLRELGFISAQEFATAFNEKFDQRDAEKRELLVESATYVDAKLQGAEDIKIGDKDFINFRLAVMIWRAAQILEQRVEDTVNIAGFTFDLDNLKKKLPNLDIKDVMLDPRSAASLKRLDQYLPDEIPGFDKGNLNIDTAIKLATLFTIETAPGVYEHLFDYDKFHMYPESPAYQAFTKSPYGDLDSELGDFFNGEGMYEDQRATISEQSDRAMESDPRLRIAIDFFIHRGG